MFNVNVDVVCWNIFRSALNKYVLVVLIKSVGLTIGARTVTILFNNNVGELIFKITFKYYVCDTYERILSTCMSILSLYLIYYC